MLHISTEKDTGKPFSSTKEETSFYEGKQVKTKAKICHYTKSLLCFTANDKLPFGPHTVSTTGETLYLAIFLPQVTMICPLMYIAIICLCTKSAIIIEMCVLFPPSYRLFLLLYYSKPFSTHRVIKVFLGTISPIIYGTITFCRDN